MNTRFQWPAYRFIFSGGLILLVGSSILCALSVVFPSSQLDFLIVGSIAIQALVGLLSIASALIQRHLLTEQVLTERAKTEKAAASNDRFERLFKSASHIAVITTDSLGSVTSFSEGAKKLFGFDVTDLLGEDFIRALHLEHRSGQGQAFVEGGSKLSIETVYELCIASEGSVASGQWYFRHLDGRLVIGDLRGTSSCDSRDVLEEYFWVVFDVTEREETYQKLKQSKTFLKLVTQRIPNMLYQYQMKSFGNDGRFTYCSEGIQRVFGLAPEDVVGLSYADSPLFKLVYPPDMEKIISATASSMEESGASYCDFRLLLPDNSLRWVRGDFYTERQPDESYIWYGSCTDINELKAREEAFRNQAITDELTGIYNRRFFMESLSRLISQARRHAVGLSLIMIDLDHFKQINDRWGHETGDHVLRQTCDLIRDRIRITDVFCRVGGEEFAILCPHTDGSNATHLAEQLRQTLAELPIAVVGTVTASFGVASWVYDESENELFRKTDLATYRAKASGRNRVEFNPE